jgi:hypothetical protein
MQAVRQPSHGQHRIPAACARRDDEHRPAGVHRSPRIRSRWGPGRPESGWSSAPADGGARGSPFEVVHGRAGRSDRSLTPARRVIAWACMAIFRSSRTNGSGRALIVCRSVSRADDVSALQHEPWDRDRGIRHVLAGVAADLAVRLDLAVEHTEDAILLPACSSGPSRRDQEPKRSCTGAPGTWQCACEPSRTTAVVGTRRGNSRRGCWRCPRHPRGAPGLS